MIESGATLNATEAFDAGIVDDVVPEEELLRVALESKVERRRTCDLPLPGSRAVRAVLGAYGAANFAEGLAVEEEVFREALQSPEAKALVNLFFAEREAVKLPRELPQGTEAPRVVEHGGKAVEVIWGSMSDGTALEQTCAGLRKAGKIPVLVREPVLERLAAMLAIGDDVVLRQEVERLVAEGVAQRTSDLRVLLVHGAGLPPSAVFSAF
jgi:hypothetical protein